MVSDALGKLQIREADCAAVFDNWRVFHGRSAFTGKRRIAGGYGEAIFEE